MIAYQEPPVVELEDLLDDTEEPEAAPTGRQIALVVGLTVVGLAGVAVLATMLVPVVVEVTRWIVFFVRYALGS